MTLGPFLFHSAIPPGIKLNVDSDTEFPPLINGPGSTKRTGVFPVIITFPYPEILGGVKFTKVPRGDFFLEKISTQLEAISRKRIIQKNIPHFFLFFLSLLNFLKSRNDQGQLVDFSREPFTCLSVSLRSFLESRALVSSMMIELSQFKWFSTVAACYKP